MKSILKKFNKNGIQHASALIKELRDEKVKWSKELEKKIQKLLLNDTLTEDYSSTLLDQSSIFSNRYEFGEYLFEKLGNINTEKELGLLTWVTFFFFNQVVEIKSDNSIVYRSQENYIPETHQFRAYRHRIIAPYLAYRNMGKDSIVILTNPTYEGGDSVNNWLSRTYFIGNKMAVKLGRFLYFDEDKKKLKPGSFSNKKGNAIHFAKNFIPQLMVNYDLNICPIDKLIDLLPSEFDLFKDSI
jgi:hypothetical protein